MATLYQCGHDRYLERLMKIRRDRIIYEENTLKVMNKIYSWAMEDL